MAITVHQIRPVAHLPLILGVVRKLDIATIIDGLIPPNPANVLSCGRGVEALILAVLDGHHALYKVGTRLDERGILPLLQDGIGKAALNDYRLGQILEALFAANVNRVFGALALKALEVYAIPTPWLHQDTTAPFKFRLTVSMPPLVGDRKSTRLNSSHLVISYAVFCLKKKKK